MGEGYLDSVVSDKGEQSWWQLLSIQAAGAVCLPVIMVGHLLYHKFGWSGALLGIGCGNLFLLVIGCFFASLSADLPRSTVEHAAVYFGKQGRIFFASLILLSMLGWFGIQLNVMGLGLEQLFSGVGIVSSFRWLNVGIGLIVTAAMCLGMKGMKWLANCSASFFGLVVVWAVFSAKGSGFQVVPLTISWLGGISLVIGVNIVGVIDLPTFFRHARSKKEAVICTLLLYGFVFPGIEMAGVYLSAASRGCESILEVLQARGGFLWIACFIFLSGWAINNLNLYSAFISSCSLIEKCPAILRIIALGAVGTLIGSLNPLGSMESMLDLFGIAIGSMGAVILSNYCLGKGGTSWASILSWSVGVLFALVSMRFHWFITGVPVFDAFVCSFIMQWILNSFKKNAYGSI